jgi:diacylglycerol kinase family enzyme
LHAPAPKPALSKAVPVFLNGTAGGGRSPAEIDALRRAFDEAGFDGEIVQLERAEELPERARAALKERPPVLVAAGGDGTISALADVVRGSDTALGVLPFGTLNHFAKDAGIPLEPVEAARAIVQGRRVSVDVGEVNGRCFLNNVSLGIYPKIVRERTQQQRRFGHSKRTAMLWATAAVLHRSPLVELRLETQEGAHDCRAPFVFVGNNDYTLEGFQIGTRARLDAGHLNVYTTRGCTARGLVGLALRALFRRLRQADDFLQSSVRSLRVESRRRRLLVAIDGEVRVMETPLEFCIRPRSLHVMVPKEPATP